MRRAFLHIAAAALLLSCGMAAAGAQAPKDGVHLGVASCAGDNCHGRAGGPLKTSHVEQDEYLIWTQKDKHSKAFAALRGDLGRRIAKNLGLPDAEHAEICLDCHADNVPPDRRGPQFRLADGVGCESCHGGASGWLGIHISGLGHAANLKAGLYPLEQPVARADRCLSCHFGQGKQFVTHEIMGAGHPQLGFELDTYTAIQPAHFRVDQDYIERKGRPDDIGIWAVGQAVDVAKRMAAILDPDKAPKGLQPELSLFDCQACHHPDNRLQWQARASTGLPPGHLRIYDATAMMLQIAAARVSPDLAAQVGAHLLALHRATGDGWPAVQREAAALRDIARRLTPMLAAHAFGRDDALVLAKAVATLTTGGADLDYSAAQQQTMALASILAAMKAQGFADGNQIKAMSTALDALYAAAKDGSSYQPDAFAQKMREFAAKVPS